jgi:hypothetical protein
MRNAVCTSADITEQKRDMTFKLPFGPTGPRLLARGFAKMNSGTGTDHKLRGPRGTSEA